MDPDAFAARYREPPPGEAPWNPVLAALLGHRSVRAYTPDPLPPGTLAALVAAAQSAPTSSNLQLWSVVAVEDADRKQRLAAITGGQRHIVQAPLFLLFLADLSRAGRMDADLGALPYLEMLVVALIDAALAAQNAVVAAESMGLGTVYIGAMRNDPEAAARELALPPGCMVAFGLCVGFEAGKAAVKPRLPQRVVLHHEQYATPPEAPGIDAYEGHLTAFQREQAMDPVGWRHIVANRLRDTGALHGRDQLRDQLVRMGFGLR